MNTFNLGQTVMDKYGIEHKVTAIFKDFEECLNQRIVEKEWLDEQEEKYTKDELLKPFYTLTAIDVTNNGVGLFSENRVYATFLKKNEKN